MDHSDVLLLKKLKDFMCVCDTHDVLFLLLHVCVCLGAAILGAAPVGMITLC